MSEEEHSFQEMIDVYERRGPGPFGGVYATRDKAIRWKEDGYSEPILRDEDCD